MEEVFPQLQRQRFDDKLYGEQLTAFSEDNKRHLHFARLMATGSEVCNKYGFQHFHTVKTEKARKYPHDKSKLNIPRPSGHPERFFMDSHALDRVDHFLTPDTGQKQQQPHDAPKADNARYEACSLCQALGHHEHLKSHNIKKVALKPSHRRGRPHIHHSAPAFQHRPRPAEGITMKEKEETAAAPAPHEMLYKIQVKTGDMEDATSRAKVYLTIMGKQGTLVRHVLQKKNGSLAFAFTRGSTEMFYVKSKDLGELYRCVVEHEGSTKQDSWFLEEISITDMPNDRSWKFACNNWLSMWHGDYEVKRKLNVSAADKDSRDFVITVFTGKYELSSRSAQPYVIFHGSKKESSALPLDADSERAFTANHKDEFELTVKEDIGALKGLKLGLSIVKKKSRMSSLKSNASSSKSPPLKAKKTKGPFDDSSEEEDKLSTFRRNQGGLFGGNKSSSSRASSSSFGRKKHLDDDDDNLEHVQTEENIHWLVWKIHLYDCQKKLFYEIPLGVEFMKSLRSEKLLHEIALPKPTQSQKSVAKAKRAVLDENRTGVVQYVLTLTTSDKALAGTDADIFVEIIGENGQTKPLVFSDHDKSKFERGSRDVLHVNAPSVGKVQAIQISHNNKGIAPGWKLEQASIVRHFTPEEIFKHLMDAKLQQSIPRGLREKSGRVILDETKAISMKHQGRQNASRSRRHSSNESDANSSDSEKSLSTETPSEEENLFQQLRKQSQRRETLTQFRESASKNGIEKGRRGKGESSKKEEDRIKEHHGRRKPSKGKSKTNTDDDDDAEEDKHTRKHKRRSPSTSPASKHDTRDNNSKKSKQTFSRADSLRKSMKGILQSQQLDEKEGDLHFEIDVPYAEESIFACDKWLSKDEGKKQLKRILKISSQKVLTSKVKVKPSEE